jgi:hypothetical protein
VKLAFLAGFVGLGLLGLALGQNPFGYATLLLALGSGIGAVIWWICGLFPRDPYSLKSLERIDREERRREIEEQLQSIDSAGNAICIQCGNHFDPMLIHCPNCGRSIYG